MKNQYIKENKCTNVKIFSITHQNKTKHVDINFYFIILAIEAVNIVFYSSSFFLNNAHFNCKYSWILLGLDPWTRERAIIWMKDLR